MRIQNLVPLCVICLCAVGPALGAQAGLREGVRVRVESPGAPRVTGIVHSVSPDSIVVFAEPGATKLGFARTSIRKLEVSQGRSAASGAMKGALWGGGIFGAIGLIAAVSADSDPNSDYYLVGESPYALALLLAVEGAGFGAIIGGFVRSEKWDNVNVQPMIGMGGNGLKLGFSMR